ncbi:MAG: (d)CMP kinase [Elusimicrobiaceae bacterium]|jgi:CMP/dCMP kinase|nr:(d)CMP kinase [Elusimicrobiaceae bacterium]MBT3954608.1 (d)CMP kinase [Elusimicrobiaceae bacterium]MBT4007916.1 (d)CMP kinase [Elusimicrobiaceae bacterium]MBT4403158.1 (d)CMP kinase [Elusimicrobiaceae bacterium]MBT4439930.1 (d)CMP kinase [Elusimicrobiaceae bacterium]
MINKVIAIDGPAGVGKSALGKRLANHFGYTFLSTGQMYRILGLKVLAQKIDPKDYEKVVAVALKIDWDFKPNKNNVLEIYADGKKVGSEIFSEEVGGVASKVSSNKDARRVITNKQRELCKKKNIVMEGRDIGTVVCPEAEVKIFLDASAEERAKRRFKQLKEDGKSADFEKILESVCARDRRDTQRTVAPLRQAEDCIYIDTTNINLEQVEQKVLEIIEKNDR